MSSLCAPPESISSKQPRVPSSSLLAKIHASQVFTKCASEQKCSHPPFFTFSANEATQHHRYAIFGLGSLGLSSVTDLQTCGATWSDGPRILASLLLLPKRIVVIKCGTQVWSLALSPVGQLIHDVQNMPFLATRRLAQAAE